MKRMAIVGVGAIGSVLGGYIAKGGEDVTLIDTSWREHVETMRKHGLRIDGIMGEHLIRVKALFIDELSRLEGKIDILFIGVKSYDTEKVLNLMKPYLAEDAWVISCQNGINEDVIIPIVGESNTVGCIVTFGAALWEPGHVTVTGTPGAGFTVGELDGQITPRIKEIARITGLCRETKITTNIWQERWAKLAGNSMANPLTIITDLKLKELFQNEKVHRIFARIVVEIIQVAEALGYKIELVSGIPADLWKKSVQSWLSEVDELILKRSAKFGEGLGSMHQDIIKGRPTEIDYLNGYVVKRGREAGIPTPVNEIIVGLVKGVENGQVKPGPDKIEHLLKLVS